MNIYFINIEKIINKIGNDTLRQMYGNYHHHFSRIILKRILEENYNITSSISEDNGRPYIKDSKLDFSISHSKNIIAIGFNDKDGAKIGLDIEFIKPREYSKVLKYYGINKSDITKEEFFQIWTQYEAEFKRCGGDFSKLKTRNIFSLKYNGYMAAISTDKNVQPILYEVMLNDLDDNIKTKNLEKFYYLTPSEIRLK